MESLESKLDHLNPNQRREVEVFVDFLLYRSGYRQGISNPAIVPRSVLKSAPPSLPVMEPLSGQDTQPVRGMSRSTCRQYRYRWKNRMNHHHPFRRLRLMGTT